VKIPRNKTDIASKQRQVGNKVTFIEWNRKHDFTDPRPKLPSLNIHMSVFWDQSKTKQIERRSKP